MRILTKIVIIIIIVSLIMYDTHTLKGGLSQRVFLGFGNIARPKAAYYFHKQNSA